MCNTIARLYALSLADVRDISVHHPPFHMARLDRRQRKRCCQKVVLFYVRLSVVAEPFATCSVTFVLFFRLSCCARFFRQHFLELNLIVSFGCANMHTRMNAPPMSPLTY